VNPSRLIVLGRDNCASFEGFTYSERIEAYPSARFELGYNIRRSVSRWSDCISNHPKCSSVSGTVETYSDSITVHTRSETI